MPHLPNDSETGTSTSTCINVAELLEQTLSQCVPRGDVTDVIPGSCEIAAAGASSECQRGSVSATTWLRVAHVTDAGPTTLFARGYQWQRVALRVNIGMGRDVVPVLEDMIIN